MFYHALMFKSIFLHFTTFYKYNFINCNCDRSLTGYDICFVFYFSKYQINVRENRSDNQEWTIQRRIGSRHRTKTKRKKKKLMHRTHFWKNLHQDQSLKSRKPNYAEVVVDITIPKRT